jgi:hypothetical protein
MFRSTLRTRAANLHCLPAVRLCGALYQHQHPESIDLNNAIPCLRTWHEATKTFGAVIQCHAELCSARHEVSKTFGSARLCSARHEVFNILGSTKLQICLTTRCELARPTRDATLQSILHKSYHE